MFSEYMLKYSKNVISFIHTFIKYLLGTIRCQTVQDVEDINDILVFEEVRVKQKRQTWKSVIVIHAISLFKAQK